MPNKNLKRLKLQSETRPKPLSPKPKVMRADRAGPTPETLAKLRPCPLKAMLHAGALDPHDPAGMTPAQYEAALEIWDAHDALSKGRKAGTVDVDKIANAHGDLSDSKARLISIYLEWAGDLGRRFYLTSSIVLAWIDDDDPRTRMTNDAQRRMLTRACDHWIKVKGDHGRASREQEMAA